MKLPDADVVIALEPHVLGLRLLPTLAEFPRGHAFPLSELLALVAGDQPTPFPLANYPVSQRPEIRKALSEAWAWLIGSALVVPDNTYLGGIFKLAAHENLPLSQTLSAR
jgi:hypothetical protein